MEKQVNIKIDSKLSGFKQSHFTLPVIDESKFKINSIIIRQGEQEIEANSGHFKIWLNSLRETKWIYANDNQFRVYKNIYDKLDNVLIIIFERIFI